MSATNGTAVESVTASPVAPPAAPPAAPPTSTPGGAPATTGPHAESEKKILENLKKVYDPEIPMNIVELGLIYGFTWQEEKVTVKMTLTAPGCPVAGILAEEVKAAVEKVPEVKEAVVDMVWEPPWTPERMSDFAKRQFGYL